jgi:hypothetical protein
LWSVKRSAGFILVVRGSIVYYQVSSEKKPQNDSINFIIKNSHQKIPKKKPRQPEQIQIGSNSSTNEIKIKRIHQQNKQKIPLKIPITNPSLIKIQIIV